MPKPIVHSQSQKSDTLASDSPAGIDAPRAIPYPAAAEPQVRVESPNVWHRRYFVQE